ncbi:Golgin subfamily A member 6-like protein, partial [Aduncisulcus paluster]
MVKITGKLLRYNRKEKKECKYADSPHLYTDPFPIHPSELVKIYEGYASVDYHLGGANMKQFLSNTEGYIEFEKRIHFPFVSPHNVQYFCVSYHESPKSVKEFNATFTTSTGARVVKEYEYAKPSGKFSWQLFPVDLDDIVQCDLESLKCWDRSVVESSPRVVKEYEYAKPSGKFSWQLFPVDLDDIVQCDLESLKCWDRSVVESSRLYSIRFLTKDFEFIDQPCIPGECMEIYPGKSLDSKVLCGLYPVNHPQVVMVDVTEASCRFTNGNGQTDLEKFLAGEGGLYFFPSLYLPFTYPHYFGEFCLLTHNWANGVKRFDATFTDSSGKRIVKKYEIVDRSEPSWFWISFPVDLPNVVSCEILIQETWGGVYDHNFFGGIRFIDNPEEITRKWRDQVGKQIDSLVSQLSGNKKQIDSLQTKITTQGNVIRKQEETIQKQMSEISSCKSLIHTQAEQIRTQEKDLKTQGKQITAQAKQIVVHQSSISEYKSDFSEKQKQIESISTILTTQGDVIRKQEETIHKQSEQIKSQSKRITAQTKKINIQANQITTQGKQITAQSEQITTLLSTTSQLQTTITKHTTTISEHRSDLDGHSKQLEDTISLIGQHHQHSDQQGSMLERTCISLQSELSALSVRVAGQSVSVAQRVQDEHDQVIEHRRSFMPDLDTLIPLYDEDS